MIGRILIEALVGITLMTLFSYALSYLMGKRFQEPELLNFLINRNRLQVFQQKEMTAGWLLHYAVGVAFVCIYEMLWQHFEIIPGLRIILCYGVVSGAVGVLGWIGMLSLTRRPPKIDTVGYLIHLVAAHVVFAFGVVLVHLVLH